MSAADEARVRLGLLVSGGGRTALNIAAACRSGALEATIAIVVAHREDAPAVARCREAGLRVAVLPPGPALRGADLAHPTAYPTPDQLEDRIDATLAAAGVELVCLAGYLRKFRVGERWRGRALNIHPGLLPRFGGRGMYGLRVHETVLAAGVAESSTTTAPRFSSADATSSRATPPRASPNASFSRRSRRIPRRSPRIFDDCPRAVPGRPADATGPDAAR